MKKTFIINATLFINSVCFSQVGINTDNPKATFEIKKSSEEKFLDGIIPPLLTKSDLNKKDYGNSANQYGTDQIGTIVYVTDETLPQNTIAKSQIDKIVAKGYYYFDGTKWLSITNDSWKLSGNNIIENEYHTANVLNSNFTIKIAKGTIKSGNFIGTLNDQDIGFKRNNEYVGLIGSHNISFGKEAFMARYFTKEDGTSTGNNAYNSNIIAIGNESLKLNNGGNNNLGIGGNTLTSNIISSNNIAMGYNALYKSTGGSLNTSGNNTSLGVNSSMSLSTGNNNTVVGMASFRNVSQGEGNVSIGSNAMAGQISTTENNKATNNVAVGNFALNNPYFTDTSTSQNNTAIGAYAGVNVRGNNNIFIGSKATLNLINSSASTTEINSFSNAMNIGNILFARDLSVKIGNTNEYYDNYINSVAKIGIGTHDPQARLHIRGYDPSVTINSNIIKEALKVDFLPSASSTSNSVLVIDENGFVKNTKSLTDPAKIGIGTENPQARLHIKGIENSELLRLEDLQFGSGRTLVIDAQGNVRKSLLIQSRTNEDEKIAELENNIQRLEDKIKQLEILISEIKK